MWDVSLKVVVVLAVMFACIAPVQGQAAPKAKAKAEARSAFDQLDDSQLMDNLVRFGMHEFVGPLTPKDMTPRSMLIWGGLQAQAMRQITDPAARLAKGGQIIEMMVKALDMAEKEMEDAEAAAEKAPPQTKTAKLLEAAKAAYLFYDIMYFLGDVSGRQAIEPYAGRLMYLQGNREDRKIILKSTKDAIMYLGDMQDELKKKAAGMAGADGCLDDHGQQRRESAQNCGVLVGADVSVSGDGVGWRRGPRDRTGGIQRRGAGQTYS